MIKHINHETFDQYGYHCKKTIYINLKCLVSSQMEAVKSFNEDQTALIRRREEDVQRFVAELAEERENSANVAKKVKQLQYHLTEAEEQIGEQKSLRARAEKHNEELTHEIKELLAEVCSFGD